MSCFYSHIIRVMGDCIQWQLRRLGLVMVMMLGAHCTFHSDRISQLIKDSPVLRTSKQIMGKDRSRCSICLEVGGLCGHYCTLHSGQGELDHQLIVMFALKTSLQDFFEEVEILKC